MFLCEKNAVNVKIMKGSYYEYDNHFCEVLLCRAVKNNDGEC